MQGSGGKNNKQENLLHMYVSFWSKETQFLDYGNYLWKEYLGILNWYKRKELILPSLQFVSFNFPPPGYTTQNWAFIWGNEN